MITDTRDPGDTSERRWVVPCPRHTIECPAHCRDIGPLISLTYGDFTSRNRGRRGLTYGGAWDGWVLRVRHPRSRVVITEHYLGRTVPELQLAAGLAAIGAEPVAVPTRTATEHSLEGAR